jgi:tetratricopeptide (TPR) repeat protein/predicted aspartyl protease
MSAIPRLFANRAVATHLAWVTIVVVASGAFNPQAAHGDSIPLRSEGGTFVLPVLINDKITLDFTLDSGAADVSIPLDVFSTLRRTHTISDADLLPSAEYTMADGSVRQQTRFRIRSVKIGGLALPNVVGSVAPSRGTLLLGQSFLSRLQTWSVDNQRHVLLINEGAVAETAVTDGEVGNGEVRSEPVSRERGATRNPAAVDAYLRGEKALSSIRDTKDFPALIAAYAEAIRLDPQYALAFASRSLAFSWAAGRATTAAAAREGYDQAQADARQALALAPDLAEAHLALGYVSEKTFDFTQASEAYERALALAPGNAQVLRFSGLFAAYMGHFDAGLSAARRAVVLDPLARQSHAVLGDALYAARRYQDAVAAFTEVIFLDPYSKTTYSLRGLAHYALRDLQTARASCETTPDQWQSQQCLAVIYDKLGRHADAEAVLAKMKATQGDALAYQYATIYAQWGNRVQALDWLETAWRLRDAGLEGLKIDPLLDPLREEPRLQAIERELKFPS